MSRTWITLRRSREYGSEGLPLKGSRLLVLAAQYEPVP